MRRNYTAALTVAFVLGATPGCAGPVTGSDTAPSAAPSASRPTSSGVLPLDFARSGGLAGLDARLHITEGGGITVTNDGVTGKPRKLDPGRLAEIKRALAEAAPPQPDTTATAVRCLDGFQYWMRTPSWSITADDCAAHTPAFDHAVALLLPLLRPDASAPATRTAG